MKSNPYTFGNSIASVQLAFALSSADKKISSRITTHLQEFNEGLRAISSMDSSKHKARIAKMWLSNFINHELTIVSEPSFNFDTTMKNVIHYRYRLWLEKEGVLNKQQQANRTAKNIRGAARAKEWIKKNIP